MKTIYTLGYSNFTIDQISQIVKVTDSVLVDVRLRAWSRNPDYCKSRIMAVFGERYLHVPEFGNVNYKDRSAPQVIKDFDGGLHRLSEINSNVILMCVCPNLAVCHRSILSYRMRQLGFDVTEIRHMSQVMQRPMF